jgi:hypothetical protein
MATAQEVRIWGTNYNFLEIQVGALGSHYKEPKREQFLSELLNAKC